MLTGAALTSGNRVEVTLNGDGTFPRLWNDLRSAQESITLQLYYGAPGRMADTLGQILVERAKASMRVFVLYDAFGAVDMPARHRDALRAAEASWLSRFVPSACPTLHLAQNRSHVRGIIIDGRIGWTGGFGIDEKWYGDGHTNGAWRETNARFEGPAVRQLQAAFASRMGRGHRRAGDRARQPADILGRRGHGGTVVDIADAGQHRRGTVLRPLHRLGPEDAVHRQLVLRTGWQLRRDCWLRQPAEASTCVC